MQFQVLVTDSQVQLFRKAFASIDQSLFSKEELFELHEVSETLEYIVQENDQESLHDLSEV